MIGPGRTSATWTVRSSRFSGRVRLQHLHLRAALDLEDADRVRRLDLVVDPLVVERDPRQVDPLAARAGDLLDAALDRRQHPEAEQVDLQEAGVGAGVLVPLDDLAALHRGRLDRAEVGQRLGRDDHAARVLGHVARQPARRRARARISACQRGDRRAVDRARLGDVASTSSPEPQGRRCARRRSTSPGGSPSALPKSRIADARPGRSRTRRRAPSGRRRSARARAGSAPRGCRAGSRGRCRAAP